MKSFALVSIAAVALLATAAAAESQTDMFRKCFCWDEEKEEFCGGSDWIHTQECKDYLWAAYGWTAPAIIGLFVLLLFPFIFYCSRICCNCCGGRHRSEGCCCPNSGVDHRVPEYTNRAIFVAKVLMSIVFGAYTYYAVGGYVTNAKLHTDIMNVLGDFDNSVDATLDLTAKSAQEIAHLSNSSLPAPHLPPLGFATAAAETQVAFTHRVHQIHTEVDNVRRGETSQHFGRAESVYRYPSCVLLVLLIIILFMACNVRKAMGPLMVLLCLTSIVEGVVFIPHMVMAETVASMCNSYNETVVPIVVGAVKSQGGCGSPGFIKGLNATAENLHANFWFPSPTNNVYPAALCRSMQTVCAAKNCTYNTCGGGSSVAGNTLPFYTEDERIPFNVAAVELVVNTHFGGQQGVPFNQRQSIVTCAMGGCADQPAEVQQAAMALAQFYSDQYASLAFLLGEAYPMSNNCSAVRDHLQNPLHGDICDGGINRRMTNVAMVLGVMYLISFLALPVVIRGMKRFMPMKRNQSLADVARETVLYADARANAVPENPPYTVAEGTAVYGAVNNDDTDCNAVRAAGDAAFERRFYGPGAHNNTDAARRPLLQEQQEEEPSSVSLGETAVKPL